MALAEGIPQIIDDLYAGTLDDVAWRRALIGTADLIDGSAAFLTCVGPGTPVVLRDEVFRCDPRLAAEYRSQWAGRDPRIALCLSAPVGEPLLSQRLLPMSVWTGSDIYNDFLLPNDAPWFLGHLLHNSPAQVVNFSVHATRLRGPFDAADAQRIQPLIPHIRCALEIKDRLELAQVRHAALASTWESVSFGIVILDDAGRVVETNAIATSLLDGTSLGVGPDKMLWLRDPAGRQLNEWVATKIPPAGKAEGLLHVWRPGGGRVSVTVTRLQSDGVSWFGRGAPGWMLLLFDPDRELSWDTAMIARDLGISAREAEIAALLASGLDMRTVAARLHISIHTVRTHLKAIFATTGVRSQAALILRVRGGPCVTSRRPASP